MASVTSLFEKELPPALDQRRSRKFFLGVALGAVGLHVLLAQKFRFVLGVPIGLGHVTQQRLRPKDVLAVGVSCFQAAPLAAVADGATEVRELVPAFSAAVALRVT